MRQRLVRLLEMATPAVVVLLAIRSVACQTPTTTGNAPRAAVNRAPAPRTPWREPDLQLRQFQLALLQQAGPEEAKRRRESHVL